MNQRPSQLTRFRVMAAMALAVLAIYLVVLFNTQVVHHEEYLAKSIQTITRMENVEASRGIITDRSGRTLVTNRSTYSLTFDASLLKPGENQNDAILRLVTLCRDQGVAWEDNLPLSLDGAAHFTVDALTDTQKGRFFSYLRDLKPTRELLAAYVRQHPELLKPPKEGETALDPATAKDTELLKQINSTALTNSLLLNAGVTPAKLFDWMREDMKLSDDYSDSDARLILGVRYELKLRKLGANNNAYVLAQNVDVAFCSLISDGQFQGAKIIRSSARQYATTYAAHILGTVGGISDYTDELKERGYRMDDTIGLSGAEAAFEDYLRGADGKRMISVNSDGKITGEYYSVEPRSGYTVELTVDLKLQQAVEDTLAAKVAQLNQKDHLDSRGAAATVIKVGTGEILALASCPSYDLSTYRKDYNELAADPAKPIFNRATSSPYAPGSTLKPATAVAALESGVTTTTETIFDPGYWKYPSATWENKTNCWKRSGHGKMDASSAITNSCNTYFMEMGYRMGLDTLNEYYSALGLGEPTGIEIGERTGQQAVNESGQDQAPWAAFGQANQEYTPLQLANYIATLVSGGKHYPAHLLKNVKSYDNSAIIATGDTEPLNTLNISDSTLQAVKKGMLGYTTNGGSVAGPFQNCVVSAGAKTGTAQIGGSMKNGVFVAFAPYDEPEIAVALVLEKADAGAVLATTAVDIINAYFDREDTASILPENQLIP
nr:penicillin-binding transpeptidase domain-containing protein [uncultured Dysosmobacter sp.]